MLMKVSTMTRSGSLGGAIANHLRDLQSGRVEDDGEFAVQAIGAAAVNQAAKGLATAREFLAGEGIEFVTRERWVDVEGEDADTQISALRFEVLMAMTPGEGRHEVTAVA